MSAGEEPPGHDHLFAFIETRTLALTGDDDRWQFLASVIRAYAETCVRQHPDWSTGDVLRATQLLIRCIRLRLGALQAMPLSANGTMGRA